MTSDKHWLYRYILFIVNNHDLLLLLRIKEIIVCNDFMLGRDHYIPVMTSRDYWFIWANFLDLAYLIQSGILLWWVTSLCTWPSVVWHLCMWCHLHECLWHFIECKGKGLIEVISLTVKEKGEMLGIPVIERLEKLDHTLK